jgi:WD40-like Beta Propeller Repeat
LNAHRTWLYEIFPWVMRGEALGTYTNTPSISGILHCLFLAEPQWNPHPWHSSPLLYSLLAPTLQTLVLAPAILLIRKADDSRQRILLEWSALLTASLAVSTIPASYNFVLMVFPVCVLASILFHERRYLWLWALSLAYLGIGFPFPVPQRPLGLALMLYVPRLPLMLAVLIGIYILLWRDVRGSLKSEIRTSYDWTQYAWAGALIASVLFSIPSTLHTERAEREDYTFRLPLASQAFSTTPQSVNGILRYTVFTLSGYHLIAQNRNQTVSVDDDGNSFDELSSTSNSAHVLVERASAPNSRIVDLRNLDETIVDDARDPMLSSDGRDLAFVRDDRGRGQLILRRSFQSSTAEVALTSPSVNVYEASFLSRDDYAYSAIASGGQPTIFQTDATHRDMPLGLGAARYPALSADGRWLAYSRFDHGVWNLWIRDQSSGLTRRIANLPCNQLHPIWDTDSKTLLYATDCGRSLWFTAIARRKVIP